jgi:peptidoglycan biosynthesis protein MviN/MurJ (putative lipid II flippase)
MRVVAKGLGLAVILGVALAFGAPLIVSVLLGHGRFTVADEGVVASLLQVLSLAFVANMGAQMLERHYIASTRNRTLAGLSVARAVIRVGTMWWLLPSQGLLAWAIGFTVSDWCYLIALAGLIRQPARAPAVLERTGHQ